MGPFSETEIESDFSNVGKKAKSISTKRRLKSGANFGRSPNERRP